MMPFALMLVAAPFQERPVFPGGDDDGTRTAGAGARCESSGDDIVVCGTADPEQFRLRKIEPRYVEPSVRAATRLGPGELSVEAEQRGLPGASAPAAMVRFRVPLGKKPK